MVSFIRATQAEDYRYSQVADDIRMQPTIRRLYLRFSLCLRTSKHSRLPTWAVNGLRHIS